MPILLGGVSWLFTSFRKVEALSKRSTDHVRKKKSSHRGCGVSPLYLRKYYRLLSPILHATPRPHENLRLGPSTRASSPKMASRASRYALFVLPPTTAATRSTATASVFSERASTL